MRQAPFIDAGERAALDSGGSGGGNGADIPGSVDLGGDDASPEILAQFGISAEDFNKIKTEFPEDSSHKVKPINAKKTAEKRPEKKAKNEDDHNLTPEEMLKALNAKDEEEGEEIPEGEDDVDDSLPEDDEDGEEEEELDQAAKADRMRHADYTKKTTELAKREKEFVSWKKEVEKEVEATFKQIQKDYQEMDEKISTLEMWNHSIDIIKEEQPELYDALMESFNGVRKQFRNPVVSRELQMLKREIAELKGLGIEKQTSSRQQSDHQIRESFNRELSQTKAKIAPQFQQLGIKIDWEAVTENWIDTGAKTVEKALYNVYGDQIAKRYQSRDKTAKVRQKVELARTPTAKRGTRAPSRGTQEINPSKMGWQEMQEAILSGKLTA